MSREKEAAAYSKKNKRILKNLMQPRNQGGQYGMSQKDAEDVLIFGDIPRYKDKVKKIISKYKTAEPKPELEIRKDR
tara:strand:- start:7382 stop:7612 length:231 start_codon:yes stop_codon:yes gene_type:complete